MPGFSARTGVANGRDRVRSPCVRDERPLSILRARGDCLPLVLLTSEPRAREGCRRRTRHRPPRAHLCHMLRKRISLRHFYVPLPARNRALHYLAHEPRLSDELREQLTQVVHGYVGPCDPVAARKGVEWMEANRDLGQTSRF
jgi:hypothetical protein